MTVTMNSVPTWWTDVVSPLVFVLIGAGVSLYATVVLARYSRFNEIMRDISHARRRAELYPLSVSDLERARDKGLDYWHFLEHARDDMDADGQHQAAGRIGRLVSFAYIATARMEGMLSDSYNENTRGSVPQRLTAFQREFNRIKNDEFVRFEESVRGEMSVFWRPLPQKRRSVIVELVNYFNDLP